jgi:hypothetical protein
MTVAEDKEKAEWVTTLEAPKLLRMPPATFYLRMKHYKFKVRKLNGRDRRISYVNLTEIRRKLDL